MKLTLRRKVNKSFFFISLILVLGCASGGVFAQTIYTWASTSSSTWTGGTNWTSGYPGSTSGVTTDLAQWGATGASSVGKTLASPISLNMNFTFPSNGAHNLSIGGLEMLSGRTSNLYIANSSTTIAGQLVLNGTTINTVSSTIISNEAPAADTLFLKTSNPMHLSFPGSSNLNILAGTVGTATAAGSVINIGDSIYSSAPLTFLGSGTSTLMGGVLALSGASNPSNFSSTIAIGNSGGTSQGVLELDNVNAITSNNAITINQYSQLYLTAAGSYAAASLNLNGASPGWSPTGTAALASAATNTWTGNIALQSNSSIYCKSGNTLTLSGNISGSGAMTILGKGTVALSGTSNSWSGGTVMNNGSLTVNSGSSLSTGALSIASNGSVGVVVTLNNAVQTVSSLSSSTSAANKKHTISLSAATTLILSQNTNTSFGIGATSSDTSLIAGSGKVVKQGTGLLTLTGFSNTFTGGLRVDAGEVRFNPAISGVNVTMTAPDTLNGGSITTTGISNGVTITLGTLVLNNNSTIDLGTSVTHSLKFSNSSALTWASGKKLNITGYTSGTNHIYVGTTASGLTSGQLAQITFTDASGNVYSAQQLSTGEVVPKGPTISSMSVNTGIPGVTSVTFTGSNFNATAANDIVYFGATKATVSGSPTTSSLTVTVPYGATYAPVSVLNTAYGLTGLENGSFLPEFNNASFQSNLLNFKPGVQLVTASGSPTPYGAAIGDIDGDGYPDLVVNNRGSSNYSIFRNTGSSGNISASTFTLYSTSVTLIGRPNNIKLADFNGDGKLDMVVAFDNSSNFYVYLNNSTSGAPSFSTPLSILTVSGNDQAVPVIADFDGDGKPDIAITSFNSSTFASTIKVFPNTSTVSSLSFGTAVSVTAGTYIEGLCVADFDGDGKPDLAAVNAVSGGVTLVRNNSTVGAIAFNSPASLTTGTQPVDIAAADIDGDGKPEIIATNQIDGTFSVFLNQASSGSLTSGSFAAKVDFTSGTTTTGVCVADLDGDGKLDVVTSNGGSNSLTLFRNASSTGSISFSTPVSLTTGSTPVTVVAGDLNGDTYPDLVVGNSGTNTVSIFQNYPLPVVCPITGTTTACAAGGTATLSDTAVTGTHFWWSDNPAKATVSALGVVTTGTGTIGDTLIIGYSKVSGGDTATATTVFTITALPSLSVSGASTVCSGGGTALMTGTPTGGSWSMTNTNASVNATSGVVTGSVVGNDSVIYTYTSVATGCTNRDTVGIVVNTSPSTSGSISGITSVCPGSTITLSDATTDLTNTWSSTSPYVTVDAASGAVTGVSAGVAVISYTVSNACGSAAPATYTVTVSPSPSAGTITGSTSLCMGSTITLSDGVGGGSWSSDSASVASVDATSGIVTGNAVGTATITYTTTACGGAYTTYGITVNALPATPGVVSGADSLCVSATTTFTDGTVGGSWSSAHTSIATVDASTGVVTGVASGVDTIIYTISTGSCGSASASKSIYFNTVPAAPGSISGTLVFAIGGTGTLTDATTGGAWSSTNTSVATIDASTGVVTAAAAGTDTIKYTVSNTCGSSYAYAVITVTSASASVALSSTAITAATVGKGARSVLLHTLNLAVTSAPATLTGLTVTTAGTYVSADLDRLYCYYSTSSTFDGSATLLSTYTSPGAAGSKVFPSFTSQSIPAGSTGYLYIVADIDTAAAAHTISIGSTAFSNFSLGTATLSGTNPVAAGNAITIGAYTEPQPWNLATSDWALYGWYSGTANLRYPANNADSVGNNVASAGTANMLFHTTSAAETSPFVASGDYSSSSFPYNGTTGTRMVGLGGQGIEWVTTGATLGEASLAINTSNRQNVQVQWKGGCIANGAADRIYNVTMNYRIGATGTWTAPSGSSWTYTDTSAHTPGQFSFGPITLPAGCNNQPMVEVRWVMRQLSGTTGSRPAHNITTILVTSNAIGATPSVAIANVSPAASNITPGTSNVLLQTYTMNITAAPDTMTGLTLTTGGTYTTSDVTNFKLWYSTTSTFNSSTATLLSTITSPSVAGSQVFPAFSQMMTVFGGTKYYFVTADVPLTATSGHTINVAATPFSNISLGSTAAATGTNPVPAANTQTILNPTVAITSTSPATGNIGVGTTNNVLQQYNMAVTSAPATISGLTILSAGNYDSASLSNLKCWYSTSSTFNAATATLLSTLNSPSIAGSHTFPSFTSQTIPVGTGYIYVTADLSTAATIGRTLYLDTTVVSNFSLGTASVTTVAAIPASNVQTISSSSVVVTNTAGYAGYVGKGRTNVLLQTYNMAVSSSAALFNGLTVNTSGTYATADVANLKCWYSSSSTFSTSTATLLGTVASPTVAGAQTFSGLTAQTLPIGTSYIYITTDISSSATAGNTIAVGTNALSHFSFASASVGTVDPAPAGATQTIEAYTDPIPYNLSGGDYIFNNWPSSSAAGTYPPNMVFHYMAVTNPTLTAATGGDYLALYNYATASRVDGLGYNGFGFFNNGSGNGGMPATQYGEAVLAVNTTGLDSVTVRWTAGTVAANSGYINIRAQYRIGTSGSFTDLPYTLLNNIEYHSSSIAGDSVSFGPILLPSTCNNVSDLEIRWIYYDSSGTSYPELNVTNIDVHASVAPTAAVAISTTSPSASSQAQGSTNVLLQTYNMAVTLAGATLSGVTINTAGTYSASDLTNLKCWYASSSTFNPATATLLSTKTTSLGSGSQVFPSFTSQSLPVGTGYIFITADIAGSATIGNTINVAASALSGFNLGSATVSGTDPAAAASSITIVAPPTVAISNTSPAAGTIHEGQTNIVLQTYDMSVSSLAATLNGLTITTAGTYTSSDFNNIKCWYSSSATFDSTTATLLSSITSGMGAGSHVFPSFTPQSIPVGNGYVFITASAADAATIGHTINVASTAFSNINLGGAVKTGTDPVPAANTQTFIITDPSPFALSGGNYTFNNWPSASAAGTYPANMVFHYMNAADPTLTSTANADYRGVYSITGNAQFEGKADTGFVFYNKSGSSIGEAVLALNSTGRINVKASWTAGTNAIGVRTYAIRGQYRIGDTGSYHDLPYTTLNQIEDTSTATAPTSNNFGPIQLPSTCDNQSMVEIRWIYYYAGTVTGTRPGMNVTNISVTSQLPAAVITGTASICSGSSTSISVTGGTPGATINMSDGSSFTLNGSGNGGESVSPVATTIYTATVSYDGVTTSATGSDTVTVLTAPVTAPITGTLSVCTSSTTTLADTTTGGTWSSVNTSVATVDATTGVVTGAGVGYDTIKYTKSNSCGTSTASAVVTVIATPATPAVISGTSSVCVAATITLSDTTAGGSWSSSNTSKATVDATTGVVTGVTTGAATISYIVSNSCGSAYVTLPITINPLPTVSSITGLSTICLSTPATLSDTVSGGTWTSTNTSVATVDATTGVVTGVIAGTDTIVYTVSNSCGTVAASKPVTISTTPSAPAAITGTLSVTVGGTTSLSDGTVGGTWSSVTPSVASVNSSGVVTGVLSGADTIKYTVSNTCGSSSVAALVTVNLAGAAVFSDTAWESYSGTSATFGIVPGGTAPGSPYVSVSQWSRGAGVSVGTTSGAYWGSTGWATSNTSYSASVTNKAYVAFTVTNGSNTEVKVTRLTLNTQRSSTGPSSMQVTYSNSGSSNNLFGNVIAIPTSQSTVSALGTVCIPPGVTDTFKVYGWGASGTIGSAGTFRIYGPTGLAATYVNGVATLATTGLTTNAPICSGNTLSLTSGTVSGGVSPYTYSWSGPASYSSTSATPSIASAATTASGTYADTIRDNMSCLLKPTISATVNPSPNAGTISGPTSVCTSSSISLSETATGGTWSSSDTTRATVNTSGVVTGVAVGSVTISYTSTTVSCGSASATYAVAVNTIPTMPGAITGTATVCTSGTTTLADTTAGGSWTSSDTTIAKVNASGVVTGIAAGSANILYTVTNTCGSAHSTAAVTVLPATVVGPISGVSAVCSGGSLSLTDTSVGGTWSSSNTSLATIDASTGVLTAVAGGTDTVQYAYTGTCGTATATAVVTIGTAPYLAAIGGVSAVCPGTSISLSDSVTGGSWSVSNTSIATIDATTGVLSGVGVGADTVTYSKSNSCGTTNVTAVVNVSSTPSAGSITGAGTVCTGSTLSLADAVPGGSWSLTNTSVATISSSGLLTGVTAGADTVIYTVTNSCGTALTSAYVTVMAAPAIPGAISGSSSVCIGSSITLSDTTTGGAWSSSSTAIATIDATTGVLLGVTAGTDTVSYTVTNSCGSNSSIAIISVGTTPSVGAISGSSSVCVGAATSLSDTTAGGTWSSTNTSRATVDATTGMVTGVAAGADTIRYTVTNTCGSTSVILPITINALPTVSMITGASTVTAGSTITLADSVSGGTWSSSNTSVATVDASTGVLTGVAFGTDTVMYTKSGACGTASASKVISVYSTSVGFVQWLAASTYTPNASTPTSSTDVNYHRQLLCTAAGETNFSVSGTYVYEISGAMVAGQYWYFDADVSGYENINLTFNIGGSSTAPNKYDVYYSNDGGSTYQYYSTDTITHSTTTVCLPAQNNPHAIPLGSNAHMYFQIRFNSASMEIKNIAYPSAGTGYANINNITLTGNPIPAPTVQTTHITDPSVSTTSMTVGWTHGNGMRRAVFMKQGTGAITVPSNYTHYTASADWSSPGSQLGTSGYYCIYDGTGDSVHITNLSCGTGYSIRAFEYNANSATSPTASTIVYDTATATGNPGSDTTSGSSGFSATISATPSTAVCAGSNLGLTVNVTGGSPSYSYTWSGPGSLSSTTASSVTVSSVSTTPVNPAYNVLVMDATGCLATASYTATVAPTPGTLSVSPASATVCPDATTGLALSATPANTYSVTGTSGTTFNFANIGGTNTQAISVSGVPSGAQVTGISVNVNMSTDYTVTDGGAILNLEAPDGTSIINLIKDEGGASTTGFVNTVISSAGSSTFASSTAPFTGTYAADAASATGTPASTVTSWTNLLNQSNPNGNWTLMGTGNASSGSGNYNVSSWSITISYLDPITWTPATSLFTNAADTTAYVLGTGAHIVYAAPASTTVYTATATHGSCTSTNTITVNTTTPPTAAISGSSTVCSGTNVTLALTGDASDTVTYTVNGGSDMTTVLDGSGNGSLVVAPVTTSIYKLVSVKSTGGCIQALTTDSAIVTITTSPNPVTIVGPTAICTGASFTLTDTVAGGTWSSSDSTIASVTSGGLMTGVANGSAMISYMVTGTCGTSYATLAVSVSATPAASAITGTDTVCSGSSVTLSNAYAGGSWSSSNAAVSTVDVSTGVVTGVAVGVDTISYTVTSSCGTTTATTPFYVISTPAVPASIAGTTSVCPAAVTTLSDATTGGVWSSTNPTVATVDTVGHVTAVATGTDTIKYTVSNSCGSSYNSAVVTVLPTNAGTISGGTSLCIAGTTTLSSTVAGGTWSSTNTAVATVDASTGVVTAVAAGAIDTIKYLVTNSCGTYTSRSLMTVNPTPSVPVITPLSLSFCPGSTSSMIAAAGDTLHGSVTLSNTSTTFVIPKNNPDTSSIIVSSIPVGATITNVAVTFNVARLTTGTVYQSDAKFNLRAPNGSIINLDNGNGASGASGSGIGGFTNVTIASNGTTAQGALQMTSANTYIASLASAFPSGAFASAYQSNATVWSSLYSIPDGKWTFITDNTYSATEDTFKNWSITISYTVAPNVTWSPVTGLYSDSAATIAYAGGSTASVYALPTSTTVYTATASFGTCSSSSSITANFNSSLYVPSVTGASTVCAGSTTTYSDSTAGGTWSSSNTGIATVDASTGVVSGVSAGTANITYALSSGTCSGTAIKTITVNALPTVASISGSSTLCTGTVSTFTDATSGGTWSSSTPSVATVDASGVVTPVSTGADTIRYAYSDGTCTNTLSQIIAVNNYPASITVAPANDTICAGAIVPLVATGGLIPGSVTFSTSTGYAVTSGTLGISPIAVSGVPAGATITSVSVKMNASTTYDGDFIYNLKAPNGSILNLDNARGGSSALGFVNTVFSSASSTSLATGTGTYTGTFAADAGSGVGGLGYASTVTSWTGLYSIPNGTWDLVGYDNYTSGASAISSWSITINYTTAPALVWSPTTALYTDTVATVAYAGSSVATVYAKPSTSTSYTITASNGVCSSSGSANITVNAAVVIGAISGSSSICSGTSTTYTDTTAGGTWSSSNTSVATIDATTGAVTALSAGTTIVSYSKVTLCGTAVATDTVTVNLAPNAGVIAGPTSVCPATTITLTDTAAGGTWSSSNPSVATIDGSGVVTGVAAGADTIYYTTTSASCGSAVASYVINVTSTPSAGSISGSSSVCQGASTTLSDGVPSGTWTSSDTTTASVNATGVVTGVHTGSATISYTVTNSCGTVYTTDPITVNTIPFAPGAIGGATSVCSGATITLTDTTAGGSWSSVNTSVATIDAATGIVTGVAGGTDTIRYTVTNTCGSVYNNTVISVNTPPVVGAITGTLSTVVGSTTTLSDTTAGGTWSSGSTSVATVGSTTGVVTGTGSGTAVISYSKSNGCGTTVVTAIVTVTGFTVGNLVVMRENGTSSAATSLTVAEYNTSTLLQSSPVSTTNLPSTGSSPRVTNSGSATSEGMMSLDAERTHLIISGYDTVAGTAGIAGLANVRRAIFSITPTGSYSNVADVVETSAFNGNNIRGVTGNGTKYYAVGTAASGSTGTAGVQMMVGTTATPISILPQTNTRVVQIYNGQLYMTTGSGTQGLYTVGTGVPTTGGITAVNVATGTGTSPYGFAVSPDGNTVYLADDATGVKRYTKSGSTYTYTYTVNSVVCRGLTADFSTTPYRVYATTAPGTGTNALIRIIDNGAGSTIDTLAYAPSSSNFRGVAFTPNAFAKVVVSASSICTGHSDTVTFYTNPGATVNYTLNGSSASVTANATGRAILSGTYTATGAPVVNTYALVSVVTSLGTSTVSGSATITVNPLPVVPAITGTSTLCAGSTTSLADTATGGTWSSSNLSVATVDATTGVVTTATAGTTIISYSKTNGCGTTVATDTVTVNNGPSITLGSTPGVCQGITSAALAYSGATGGPTTYSITYSSAAHSAGFADVTAASLSGGVITLAVPAAAPAASYSGTLTVSNGTCTSVNYTATVNVIAIPTAAITSATPPCTGYSTSVVFSGSTGAVLDYVAAGDTLSTVVSGGSYTLTTGTLTSATNYELIDIHEGTGTCYSIYDTIITINPIPMQWTGASDTNWNNAANWSCGFVPTVSDDVSIPSGTPYAPSLAASGSATTRNLSIASGATLKLYSSSTLNVKGTLANNSTITGAGTLSMSGTTAQHMQGMGYVSNLDINNTAGVNVDSGARPVITGALSLSGGMLSTGDSVVLNSDSTNGTARIAPITTGGAGISGKVQVRQYIAYGHRAYRFWSHPFSSSMPLSEIEKFIDVTGDSGSVHGFTNTFTNAPSAFWYNPLHGNSALSYDPGWNPIHNAMSTANDTDKVRPYEGFRLFIRGSKGEGLAYPTSGPYTVDPATVGMSGPVNQGTKVVYLQKGTGANQDYNQIGNPYASPVNIGSIAHTAWANGQITGSAIFLWNPYIIPSGNWVSVNVTTGTPYYMEAYTSFQVRAAANGDSLVFHETDKASSSSASLLRAAQGYLSLAVYDVNYQPWDMLRIQFNDQATDNEDNAWDAVRPSGPSGMNFYAWSADEKKMAIDGLPYADGKVIPLGLTSGYAQDFIMKVQGYDVPAGGQVYLHDKLLNQYTKLTDGMEYRFTITSDKATQGDNRFELRLGPVETAKVNGLDVTMTPNPATDMVNIAFTSGKPGETKIRMTDVSGVSVYNKDLGIQQQGSVNIPLDNFAAGIYMVELTNGDQKVVQRLVKE